MVFFTCSHCGDSLKKVAVAKHYQTKCGKKEPFLTCIDCLKDFKGNEYEAHTKCVSEGERYAAKGSARKQTLNKGEKKQQAWHECIQTVLKKPTLKGDERDFIRVISKYENVPRKKAKFINFLTNAFKQYANKADLIDRVWKEMESVFKEASAKAKEEKQQQPPQQKPQQQQQQQQQKQQKQEPKNVPKKPVAKPEEPAAKKEKKRKRQAEEEKVAESGESGKSEATQKKKKQKQVEEKPAVGNDDALMFDADDDNEQGKINRKRKADNDQTELNDSVPDEAEPGKKKKKKKNDKSAENQVTVTPAEKPEEESKGKKNKKPKTAGEQTKQNNAPSGGGDANAAKKEKKVKKSENKENEKAPVKKAAADNAQGEADKPAAKKKKPAAESGGQESKQEAQFDWKATILQVLNQDGKNNRIQLQKLQQKVLKLHCQILNCETSDKKEKKFMKKLKEMPEIVLDKDFVELKS